MANDLILHTVSDLQVMAESIARSGLFGMKTPDQAMALMLVAQAENAHPATITQDYDIIQGRAARKTHSVLARFQKAGGKVEWHELSEQTADATFSHPSGGSLRMTWTFEQAKKAMLTGKDNWKNYPRAMLRARCIAEGVRAVYPAAIGGMLITEEAQDLDGEPTDQVRHQKPAVNMPQAKAVEPEPQRTAKQPNADVTDVEVKQTATASATTHSNDNLASVGEVNYLKARMAKFSIGPGTDTVELCKRIGLNPRDTLDGLTKDEFIAIKDALK